MIEMNYHFCISLILQSWPTINSTDWLIPKECLYTTTVDYEARWRTALSVHQAYL